MKSKELRLLNQQDLDGKIVELRQELMKINSQIAVGTLPKSPGRVKEVKRTIAKIFTLKQQRRNTISNE